MASFAYQPLGAGDGSFRLLRLYPSAGREVRGTIVHASFLDLESEPYEALSYTWGSNELVETIIIDDKDLWVTENLYSALKYLEPSSGHRTLWIDGICINQDDLDERSQQVQHMGQLFSHASRVIFWLGRATAQMNNLMDDLKRLEEHVASENSVNWRIGDKRWQHAWSKITNSEAAAQDIQHHAALQAILERPWFSRVWIVQEVANASQAIVCVGNRSVAAHIFAISPTLLQVTPEPHGQSILDIMPEVAAENSWWQEKKSLRMLITKFRGCKATDERDMVFALLGMSEEPRDLLHNPVSYSDSAEDVIHRAMTYLRQVVNMELHEILDLMTSFVSITTIVVMYFADMKTLSSNEPLRLGFQQGSGFDDAGRKSVVSTLDDALGGSLPLLVFEHRENRSLERQGTYYHEVVSVSKNKAHDMNEDSVTHIVAAPWDPLSQSVQLLAITGQSTDIMMLAWTRKHLRILDLLIEEVNHTYFAGHLPDAGVYVATRFFHCPRDFIKLMLTKGANPNSQKLIDCPPPSGRTPKLLPYPYSHADFYSEEHCNAFALACYQNYHDGADVLLEHGANVNTPLEEYGNVFQMAILRRYFKIAMILIKHDVDIHRRGGIFDNPLQAAAVSGDARIVELLLDMGMDANIQGGLFGTPLQAACISEGTHAIVPMLLDRGAEVNATGGFFGTALHAAVAIGNTALFEQLIKAGADLSLVNRHGWTPSMLAESLLHAKLINGPRNFTLPKAMQVAGNSLPPSRLLSSRHQSDVSNANDSGAVFTFGKVNIFKDWETLSDRFIDRTDSPEDIRVISDHPFPHSSKGLYYEIEILEVPAGNKADIRLGFAVQPPESELGLLQLNYIPEHLLSYHYRYSRYACSTLQFPMSNFTGMGCIIGCEYHAQKGKIFFTCDGKEFSTCSILPSTTRDSSQLTCIGWLWFGAHGQVFPYFEFTSGPYKIQFSCNFGERKFRYKSSSNFTKLFRSTP